MGRSQLPVAAAGGTKDQRVRHTAPEAGLLLPHTRDATASSDRLVAALVIMIQQASRNVRLDAATLAPSKRLRTT